MKEEEVKGLISRALTENGVKFEPSSLRIRYYQDEWERIDAFGEYLNDEGYYEFAISVDKKGKVKRFHVNMISPRSVFEELKKLKRE